MNKNLGDDFKACEFVSFHYYMQKYSSLEIVHKVAFTIQY